MKNKIVLGHFIAFIAITLWGITFVSTKILLSYLDPIEIMISRFVLAYLVLILAYPKFEKVKSWKDELSFFLAGTFGLTLYFIFEIFALERTTASNVALLISVAPILTAILAHVFTKDEKFTKGLLIGFIVSISGIALVIFNDTFYFSMNITGSLLAVAAAVSCSSYLVILKKISSSYNRIVVTRKVFFYGIVTSLPVAIILRPKIDLQIYLIPQVYLHLLFLGIIASALCFFMWNVALSYIGAIKLSAYTYLLPLVGMIASVIFLSEKITIIMGIGGILILTGTYVSENASKLRKYAKRK